MFKPLKMGSTSIDCWDELGALKLNLVEDSHVGSCQHFLESRNLEGLLFSVAFCSPAKSCTFSGLMENPSVGKQLKP